MSDNKNQIVIDEDEDQGFNLIYPQFENALMKQITVYAKPSQNIHKKFFYRNMEGKPIQVKALSESNNIIQIKNNRGANPPAETVMPNSQTYFRLKITTSEKPCTLLCKVAIVNDYPKGQKEIQLREGIQFKIIVSAD